MKVLLIFSTLSLLLTTGYAQDGKKVNDDDNSTEESSQPASNKKQTVSISPATLYFNAGQGESQTQNVNIVNGLPYPVQFKVSLADFMKVQSGGVEYSPAASLPQSCAKWVTLGNNYVEVQPGEKSTVPITLEVPDTSGAIEEMKWVMVFLEGMEQDFKNTSSGSVNASIKKNFRVGVQVYQTPPNILKKELRMVSFKALPIRGHYKVTCVNDGSVLLRCLSYIDLISSETGEKTRVYPDKEQQNLFKILPGQTRDIDFVIPSSTPKGTYTGIAIIDANDDEVPLEAAQLEVELK